VLIGVNKVLSGAIFLRESVRSYVMELVRFLRGRGIRVVITSGDSRETVEAIAKEVDVDEVYSELTPEDKVELGESAEERL